MVSAVRRELPLGQLHNARDTLAKVDPAFLPDGWIWDEWKVKPNAALIISRFWAGPREVGTTYSDAVITGQDLAANSGHALYDLSLVALEVAFLSLKDRAEREEAT